MFKKLFRNDVFLAFFVALIICSPAFALNTTTSQTPSNAEMQNVDINGGAIDGTAIGAATPSTGAFTTLSATDDLEVQGDILASEKSESLSLLTTASDWTGGNGWTLNGTTAVYAHNATPGDLTQASADMQIPIVGSKNYILTYTVSGLTDTGTALSARLLASGGITNSNTKINISANGVGLTRQFTSTSSPTDFIIDINNGSDAGDTFTLSDVSLKEQGDLVVTGAIGVGSSTANAVQSPGLLNFDSANSNGTVGVIAIRGLIDHDENSPGGSSNYMFWGINVPTTASGDIKEIYPINSYVEMNGTGITAGEMYGAKFSPAFSGDGTIDVHNAVLGNTEFYDLSGESTITDVIGMRANLRQGIQGAIVNITNYHGFLVRGEKCTSSCGADAFNVTLASGLSVENFLDYPNENISTATGVKLSKQTNGTANTGLWLTGNGTGADIAFGASLANAVLMAKENSASTQGIYLDARDDSSTKQRGSDPTCAWRYNIDLTDDAASLDCTIGGSGVADCITLPSVKTNGKVEIVTEDGNYARVLLNADGTASILEQDGVVFEYQAAIGSCNNDKICLSDAGTETTVLNNIAGADTFFIFDMVYDCDD